MKTDRFSLAPIRTAAVVLAGLLFVASQPEAAQIVYRMKSQRDDREEASKRLALVLAATVGRVQERFDKNRSELRTVKGPDGKPAYLREEVADLIARTGEDLGEVIAQARPSGMEPLLAWSHHKVADLQEGLAALPGQKVASFRGLSAPRAGAPGPVFASLRSSPPTLARASTAAPKQGTVPAEPSERLLDQMGEAVGRLLFLAKSQDLEVDLWVGSTPEPNAKFSFWPQGKLKGSTPKPLIIRTAGKRSRVLRGLYAYEVIQTQVPGVKELMQYPVPEGAPWTRNTTERLNLVEESSFFCCSFDEQYCRHVDDPNECRP